jgi:cytochrome c oxidase subunit 2
MIHKRFRHAIAYASALPASGCASWQSALDAQGVPALGLKHLMSVFGLVCLLVWLLVVLVLWRALVRPRGAGGEPLDVDPASRGNLTLCVNLALVATICIVAGLTLLSYFATRPDPASPDSISIQLRAHQFWWEAIYGNAAADQVFTTANELHVPVGRTVHIQLSAADVIHSFWVPSLAGKQDLIPGRLNELSFTAQRAGLYRGQCAEFCGLQHAHMAILIVAESPEDYENWRRAQVSPAVAPTTREQQDGRKIFSEKACGSCHTVRGTSSAATVGPDLTHVGGRHYIAAGMIETSRGSLAAWIADPQTIKPGNNMPMVPLNADEINAVSDYMASLK